MLETMKHLEDSIAAHSISGVSATLEMKTWMTELKNTRAEFERLEQHDKLVRECNEKAETELRKKLSKLAAQQRPRLLHEYKQLFAL
jgi:pyruvate-formate lyase